MADEMLANSRCRQTREFSRSELTISKLAIASLLKNDCTSSSTEHSDRTAQALRHSQNHGPANHGPSGGTRNVGIMSEFDKLRISPILIGECSYWVKLSFRVVIMRFLDERKKITHFLNHRIL